MICKFFLQLVAKIIISIKPKSFVLCVCILWFAKTLDIVCFLFHIGNASVMKQVAETADGLGKNNVSFLSYFMLGNLEKCLDILITTNRIPEAAFFAR